MSQQQKKKRKEGEGKIRDMDHGATTHPHMHTPCLNDKSCSLSREIGKVLRDIFYITYRIEKVEFSFGDFFFISLSILSHMYDRL